MGFFEEIVKPDVEIVVLFEYDLPITVPWWFHKEAGILQFAITQPDASYVDPDGTVVIFEYVNAIEYDRIGSVLVNNELYSSVSSLANLRTQNKSFYYERSSTILYLHLDEFDWPLDKRISPAVAQGFCDGVDGKDGIYFGSGSDRFYFEPRLLSVPNLTRKKDPLFFGLFNFISNTVKLDNTDGFLDAFGQNNEFGRSCRYWLGTNTLDFDDFYKAYEGRIQDFTRPFESLVIKAQEKREVLQRKIPVNKYSTMEYPYLNEENEDREKPIAYGVNYDCPTICIDQELSAPTNNTFSFLDTSEHTAISLDVVNLVEDGIKFPLTVQSTDLVNGTFELLHDDCFDASDNLLKITCGLTAADASGFDQITDLMNLYDSTAFISSNYDATEWNANKALYDIDVSTYIGKETELKNVIENICKTIVGIFYPIDSGLYTLRVRDIDNVPVKAIPPEDFKTDPTESQPQKEFLSSCLVEYKRNEDTDKYTKKFKNTSFQAEAEAAFNQSRSKTFQLNVSNRVDAEDRSNLIMETSKEIVPTYTVKTDLRHIDLDIFDFVYLSFTRPLEDEDYKIYEVVSRSPNLTNDEITFLFRYVRDTDYNRNFGYWDQSKWDQAVWK